MLAVRAEELENEQKTDERAQFGEICNEPETRFASSCAHDALAEFKHEHDPATVTRAGNSERPARS